MKTRLSNVRVNVSDFGRSVRWYQEVLGFQPRDLWPLEKPNFASFEAQEGSVFSIMEDRNFPSYGRFNFYVSDVDGLWEELKDKVEVVEPLFSTPWGSRKFTIKDPDGNELGFVQGE